MKGSAFPLQHGKVSAKMQQSPGKQVKSNAAAPAASLPCCSSLFAMRQCWACPNPRTALPRHMLLQSVPLLSPTKRWVGGKAAARIHLSPKFPCRAGWCNMASPVTSAECQAACNFISDKAMCKTNGGPLRKWPPLSSFVASTEHCLGCACLGFIIFALNVPSPVPTRKLLKQSRAVW